MTVTFGSVCSGIEAASVAWHPLGWQTAWLAEIERAPAVVLAHHYPSVWNLGDMTAIAPLVRAGILPAPDVLVGGTPCQAFSIAGLRNSLNDARGQLSLSFVDLANAIDEQRDTPAVIVWENVPGVLNTKDNAFGCFLAALAGEDEALISPGGKWSNAGCVYGPQRTVAWRVLDAQYFGVAQRRRRVFVVASARDDFDCATVLFESEGMRRDSPPGREKRESITHPVAPCLTSSGRGVERGGDTRGQDPVVACFGGGNTSGPIDPAACLTAKGQRIDFEVETFCVTGAVTHTLTAEGHDASEDGTGRGQPIVAFHSNAQPDQMRFDPALSASLTCSQNSAALIGPAVRRLTPMECERLQGFPDGYTAVPHRGKVMADGPRYKMLGNSMAVPCMAWLGARIDAALRRAHNAPEYP